jgi:hypothetical protein
MSGHKDIDLSSIIFMADESIAFERILLKKHHYWRDLIIILVIALIIASAWQYLGNFNSFAPSTQSTTTIQGMTTTNLQGTSTTMQTPNSLIDDENYVQGKINDYLKDNPRATEDYARDVVYLDIARAEKNAAICDKIKDSELKYFCSNAVR